MSIAIFTPTYNRASLLERCYDSLLDQTDKDFTWLIIDDGSTDETRRIVDVWIREGKIDIQYHYQENGGKHKAHNTAVENCTAEYMLIFDSDDMLDKTCVAVLKSYVSAIDSNSDVCGLIGDKYQMKNHKLIGDQMPSGIEVINGRDLYQRYGYKGDTLRLYKVKVLKEFLFPIIPNEKFIYENVVFDQIDARYSMKIIHERLYYCDYRPDGYTANAAKIKLLNPLGYSLSLSSSVQYSVSLSKKINWTLLYIIWCKKMNIKNSISRFHNKVWYVLLYPLALLMATAGQPRFFFKIINQKTEIE